MNLFKGKISTFKNISCIYQIYNVINGTTYIGSAIKLDNRLRIHKHSLLKNNHHSDYLQRAFNKYGEENFEVEIIERLRNQFANESINDYQSYILKKEQFYIDTFDTYINGYNVTPKAGNSLGYKHRNKDLDCKRKSILQYDLNGNFIKEWPSITEASVFYKISICCIIDAIKNNRQKTAAGFQWRYKKNNYIKLIIDKPKLKESGRKSIPIVQIDMNNNFICNHLSINEAGRSLNINRSAANIALCVSGKLQKAYGFKWMKLEDYKKLNKQIT